MANVNSSRGGHSQTEKHLGIYLPGECATKCLWNCGYNELVGESLSTDKYLEKINEIIPSFDIISLNGLEPHIHEMSLDIIKIVKAHGKQIGLITSGIYELNSVTQNVDWIDVSVRNNKDIFKAIEFIEKTGANALFSLVDNDAEFIEAVIPSLKTKCYLGNVYGNRMKPMSRVDLFYLDEVLDDVIFNFDEFGFQYELTNIKLKNEVQFEIPDYNLFILPDGTLHTGEHPARYLQ